jgi:hypothetical protein
MIAAIWALTPSWLKMLVGCAIVTAVVASGTYFKGRLDQKALCQEASLRVKIEGLQRDLTAQRLADAAEEAELQTLKQLADAYEAEIAAYEIELQTRPNPNCALSPRDIDSLYGGKR